MTLNEAAKILSEAGIKSARDEARIIFHKLGGIPRHELVCSGVSSDSESVASAVLRRASREPLQYIIGECDFYRESYLVTPDCLIPRSDTEILVDFAVKNIPEGAHFIDLCTGSGCVALSVLNNTSKTNATAVDISDSALSVARKNAERLGLCDRIDFICRDALASRVAERAFAVLSNPPYVADACYEGLEPEIFAEPKAAFVGGEDGCDFYRILTPMYKGVIDKDGFIAYEIGYDQADTLRSIAGENGMSCEIIRDLGGKDRVAVLRL